MAKGDGLTPFKKGEQRAVDAGRKSKRRPLDERIRKEVDSLLSKKKDGKTYLQIMAEVAYRHYLAGNERPIKWFIERGFGSVKSFLELTGAGGAPLEPPIINIVGVEANGKKDTKKKTKKKKTK